MIRKLLSKFGGEGFASEVYPLRLLLKAFWFQKVIGINRSVTWPVHWTSKVINPEKINRGTRFPGISMGCHIDGRNGIEFGTNVWVGPHVTIVSMNHDTSDYESYISTTPIIIDANSWIAARSVILPSVHLGKHTVVAAGSVVTKSFPDGNQLLAGVPARVVKKLPAYKAEKISDL